MESIEKKDIHALIDFGSNTVNLVVYRISGSEFEKLYKSKRFLGIIGYVEHGVLSGEGIEKSVEILKKFKTLALTFTENIDCFATASLREIQNTAEAVEAIERETGINITVFSAEQETYYDYVGAIHALPLQDMVVADVGGGSIQVLSVVDRKLKYFFSIQTGVLKLYLDFMKSNIPETKEKTQIKDMIRDCIHSAGWSADIRHDDLCVIGGSAKAIAKLHRDIYSVDKIDKDYCFDAGDLQTLIDYFTAMDGERFEHIKRRFPERAETLLAGLLVFHEIAQNVGAKKIYLSKYGVREGYLIHHILKYGEI